MEGEMRRLVIVRHSILLLTVLGMIVAVLEWPPLPQPSAYHVMADQRTFLGVPNCLNVLSNLPFALVGLLGLSATFSHGAGRAPQFLDPWERWPYAALFVGVTLTTLGSGYYHLAPDNARLVWDRLPMAVGFMGLLTALLAERVSLAVARWLFGPLLVVGATSVAYWYWSELQNAGDLRPYLLVQFGSLLLVLLMLVLYPARYPGTRYLAYGLVAYAVAKVFELADQPIYALGYFVSGHTLKHIVAAGGVACLAEMLRARTRSAAPTSPSSSARVRSTRGLLPR
jgi:hypothetical protein